MDNLLNLEFLQTQLFWLVLSFTCLLAVMWKFVTPALAGTLDARSNQIREDLERAENLKADAEKLLKQYEEQLKSAQSEASEIVSKARTESENLTALRTKELEEELSRKATAAAESIEQAKNKAMDDLRKEVVALTVAATEQVVGNVMDAKTAEKFADEAVKGLN